jgi:protein ImuA
MPTKQIDTIAQLRRDILSLEGYNPLPGEKIDIQCLPIEQAFPNESFPPAALHEFISHGPDSLAATAGFIATLVSALMKQGGAIVWINSRPERIYPPALKQFNIVPEHVLFVSPKRPKQLLWATEEALKCNGLAAVVSEIPDLDFILSRRLQLAAKQSRVSGFILRPNPVRIVKTACASRWQINPILSVLPDEMPGIGYPRWHVELKRATNGKENVSWQMEWTGERLQVITAGIAAEEFMHKNVG